MAALCENDTEDFVTCSVCLCEFDADVRKPKFLPCSHTLCLECLKEIHCQGSLSCPLCRKILSHSGDVSSLPNNPYALHILKLKKQQTLPPQCGAQKSHLFNSTVKDFADFLTLKKDLKKVKKDNKGKLSLASTQRKKVKQHMEDLEDYFTRAKNEISILKNLNKTELDAIETQLFKCTSPNDKGDPSSLSDLVDLVSDAEQGDTVAILRDKMKKNINLCQKRLEEANTLVEFWESLRKGGRVSVQINGQSNDVIISSNSSLLSYAILYLMKCHSSNPSSELTLSSSSTGAEGTIADDNHEPVRQALARPINKCFNTLIVGVKLGDNLKGKVHIKLNPNFPQNVIQRLGEFCYKSPKLIADCVSKAIPGIFVILPMFHLDFQSNLQEASNYSCSELASYNADVGIYMNTNWSLLFTLNYFNAPESRKHVEPLEPSQLLGRVTSGMDLIVMLTRKNFGFSFTLEAL